MKNYLEGKSITVTGAASGFGRLVAQRTCEMGANVAVNINEDKLAENLSYLESVKGQAQNVAADVTRYLDMKDVADKAIERFGKIDIILNNAGVLP